MIYFWREHVRGDVIIHRRSSIIKLGLLNPTGFRVQPVFFIRVRVVWHEPCVCVCVCLIAMKFNVFNYPTIIFFIVRKLTFYISIIVFDFFFLTIVFEWKICCFFGLPSSKFITVMTKKLLDAQMFASTINYRVYDENRNPWGWGGGWRKGNHRI